MTGFLSALVTQVEIWALILVLSALYYAYTLRTVGAADNEETRRAIHMLREERWRRTYAALIAGWLDRLDRLWTKELRAETPPFPAHSPRAAFSHGLLNFTLVFALAYPILGLLLHWLATGEAQSVGGVEVIPAAAAWWERPATMGALTLVCLALLKTLAAGLTRPSIWALAWRIVAISYCSTFIFVTDIVIVSMVMFAYLAAIQIRSRLSGLISYIIAVSIAAPATATIAFYLLDSGVTNFISTIGGVILTIFIINFASALTVVWLGNRLKRPALLVFLWALLGVAAILLALLLAPEIRSEAAGLIVFIGLLPLLNGLTDFLSTGMTRFLLRRAELAEGRWARPALWLFDLLFALFTLALLIGAFIAFVTLVRPASGVPLIDVLALIEDVRARPGNYWWLGFMVFTTLLPSLIHMVAASYSLALFYLPEWRAALAARLEAGMAGDGQRGAEGRVRLVALMTLAWGGPTALLWSLLSFLWGERVGLREWSLGLAEGFARWVAGVA